MYGIQKERQMEARNPARALRQTEGFSRRQLLCQAIVTSAGLPWLFTCQDAAAIPVLSMPSPTEQKRLGAQAAAQILSECKEIKDGRAAHFAEIGRRLVKALPPTYRNPWNFEFHVVESKEINAFSLPGGPMFMFTGLYQRLQTDDAVAAVTGHELAHVYSQHWAKAYAKEHRRALVVDIAAILSGHFIRQEVLGRIAAGLMKRGYSRAEEDQ